MLITMTDLKRKPLRPYFSFRLLRLHSRTNRDFLDWVTTTEMAVVRVPYPAPRLTCSYLSRL